MMYTYTLLDITLIYPNCILFQCNSHKKSDNVFLIMYFSQWVSSKESNCKAGDPGSTPGLGRYPGGRHGNPLQYSCLENPMTEEPGSLQSWSCKEFGMTDVTEHAHAFLNKSYIIVTKKMQSTLEYLF